MFPLNNLGCTVCLQCFEVDGCKYEGKIHFLQHFVNKLLGSIDWISKFWHQVLIRHRKFCHPPSFKGIVSRDENLFAGHKNQNSTFCMIADGFHNLWLSFFLTSKIKFLLASMKPLTNCKSYRNPLQKVCFGFSIAVCDSKSCSKSRRRSCKLLRSRPWMHRRKSTYESKGKLEQKFEAAFGIIFRTVTEQEKSRKIWG